MTSSRVTSRLVRSERRKMTKQIFWFGGLTVVLILAFLFIVLPLFIRFVNEVLDRNPISEEPSEILLQAPVLAAPPDATNSAQLRLSGVTTSDSAVFVIVNSQQQVETRSDEEGQFSTDVQLSEGDNTIVLFGRDPQGVETRNSREYIVHLDRQAPSVELESPEEDQEFERRNPVEIRGTTDPDARVLIEDRVVYPRSDGSFSYSLQLDEGEHTLRILVIDKAGNQTELERRIRIIP